MGSPISAVSAMLTGVLLDEMREASIVVDKTRSAYPALAVELNSAPFIRALETGVPFWPQTMPEIDGVVLCYDASREGHEAGSFGHIVELSSKHSYPTALNCVD